MASLDGTLFHVHVFPCNIFYSILQPATGRINKLHLLLDVPLSSMRTCRDCQK